MHGERGPILVAPVEGFKAMNVKLMSTQISKVISRSPFVKLNFFLRWKLSISGRNVTIKQDIGISFLYSRFKGSGTTLERIYNINNRTTT